MQFSLLYRYDQAGAGPVNSDIDGWIALSNDLEQAGKFVHETGFFDQAVSVTVDAAGAVTTRAEPQSAQPIAGQYTIKVDDLDEAIEWAAKMPVAGKGTVEIRQVVEFEA